jgi:predicted unusual protein kinase regulating ubiquinone biosynthesis (AarF/ABC1/UbiB family)
MTRHSSQRHGRWLRPWISLGAVAAACTAAALIISRRARPGGSVRTQRNLQVAGLGAQIGATYVGTAARKLFATSAAQREQLDRERELKTAEAIADRLGNMKGALMKLGQMASYVDDGLPEPLRQALAALQDNAPPMSAELAKQVIESELGAPLADLFVEWDPHPLAAASIGQVHRAIVRDPVTGQERAVAVKVQYPGVAESIDADLRNADLLGVILKQGFGGLDPDEMVAEVKARIVEELDYRIEAANQQRFVDFYHGHPTIHIPEVVHTHSARRVLTTELVNGDSWATVLTWSQAERDRVGETLFRFVFRSLYGMRAFNGDPHPGNYRFHRDGRVTFFDFGLVKHFTDEEMDTFISMVRTAAYENDMPAFRAIIEGAGMLRAGSPASDAEVGEYFSQFYETVREDRTITWSSEYASRIVRHTFDRTSPISQYATVPRAFVFIQRINLGLYALLGQLGANGNYRRIAEELWPFVQGPPSTPMAMAEHRWIQRAHPTMVSGR